MPGLGDGADSHAAQCLLYQYQRAFSKHANVSTLSRAIDNSAWRSQTKHIGEGAISLPARWEKLQQSGELTRPKLSEILLNIHRSPGQPDLRQVFSNNSVVFNNFSSMRDSTNASRAHLDDLAVSELVHGFAFETMLPGGDYLLARLLDRRGALTEDPHQTFHASEDAGNAQCALPSAIR